MGQIKGKWLDEQQKLEIVLMVEEAKKKGVVVSRSCALLGIGRRRVDRWRRMWKEARQLNNSKPGPKKPVHTLLAAEREAVLQMARAEKYADLGHRPLAVWGWDLDLFFVSFSSVYRILSSENLIGMRGSQRPHNGGSLAPVRKEITGANQRWCWDISYLRTYEKGLFLYLYLLLDEYSRKAIHWLVSWHQRAEEASQLIEGGLMAENILDLPEDQRPEVINDRGRQMKAKSIRRMFQDHQMPQFFARPRTPNDNPYVESLFGTVKTAPQYPGRFLDLQEAAEYFNHYFPWYNEKHYHSAIDYVTPDQCHQGLREIISAERKKKLSRQRLLRKEVNRITQNLWIQNPTIAIIKANCPISCSVMLF